MSPFIVRHRQLFRVDTNNMITNILKMIVDRLMFALQVATYHSCSIECVLPFTVKKVPVSREHGPLFCTTMFRQSIRTSPDIEFTICGHLLWPKSGLKLTQNTPRTEYGRHTLKTQPAIYWLGYSSLQAVHVMNITWRFDDMKPANEFVTHLGKMIFAGFSCEMFSS